jgi:hypothetical protein
MVPLVSASAINVPVSERKSRAQAITGAAASSISRCRSRRRYKS